VGRNILENQRVCPPFRFGRGSTVMSGPSGSVSMLASGTKRWIMASRHVTRVRCSRCVSSSVRRPSGVFSGAGYIARPSPFSAADSRAGYVHALAFRRFEVSETCAFDWPQAVRMWFEGIIRDHLDIGQPDQVAIIFGRAIKAVSRTAQPDECPFTWTKGPRSSSASSTPRSWRTILDNFQSGGDDVCIVICE
jgi:hypothetical protein